MQTKFELTGLAAGEWFIPLNPNFTSNSPIKKKSNALYVSKYVKRHVEVLESKYDIRSEMSRIFALLNFLRLASQRLDRIKLRLHDNCLKAIEEHVKQNFVFVVSFRKED